MSGPLQGIRVIETWRHWPGPFCGMMLADMGRTSFESSVLGRIGGCGVPRSLCAAGDPFGSSEERRQASPSSARPRRELRCAHRGVSIRCQRFRIVAGQLMSHRARCTRRGTGWGQRPLAAVRGRDAHQLPATFPDRSRSDRNPSMSTSQFAARSSTTWVPAAFFRLSAMVAGCAIADRGHRSLRCGRGTLDSNDVRPQSARSFRKRPGANAASR